MHEYDCLKIFSLKHINILNVLEVKIEFNNKNTKCNNNEKQIY